MEKLTKAEISWTMSALQMSIDYYEQLASSTSQMERSLANLQAENLVSVKRKLERVLSSDCKRIAVE